MIKMIETHQNTGGAILTGCMFKPGFAPDGHMGTHAVACGELDAPERMPAGQVTVQYSIYSGLPSLVQKTVWRD